MDTVTIDADYARDGDGWQATVVVPGLGMRVESGIHLREVYEAVVAASADAAARHNRPCRTVHTLAGDQEAFAVAAKEGGVDTTTPHFPLTIVVPEEPLTPLIEVPTGQCPYRARPRADAR